MTSHTRLKLQPNLKPTRSNLSSLHPEELRIRNIVMQMVHSPPSDDSSSSSRWSIFFKQMFHFSWNRCLTHSPSIWFILEAENLWIIITSNYLVNIAPEEQFSDTTLFRRSLSTWYYSDTKYSGLIHLFFPMPGISPAIKLIRETCNRWANGRKRKIKGVKTTDQQLLGDLVC